MLFFYPPRMYPVFCVGVLLPGCIWFHYLLVSLGWQTHPPTTCKMCMWENKNLGLMSYDKLLQFLLHQLQTQSFCALQLCSYTLIHSFFCIYFAKLDFYSFIFITYILFLYNVTNLLFWEAGVIGQMGQLSLFSLSIRPQWKESSFSERFSPQSCTPTCLPHSLLAWSLWICPLIGAS